MRNRRIPSFPGQGGLQARPFSYILVSVVILGLLALLPLPNSEAAPQQRGFFLASSKAIRYFGRVQRGADVLWTWPGTGLRVAYANSAVVKLRLRADSFDEDSSRNAVRMVWYKIDNGTWMTFTLPASSPASPDVLMALQTPNDRATHTLDVVKASEGQLTFRGVELDPGGKLIAPVMRAHRIEVVGDSISAGFKVHGDHGFELPGDHDARATYGWLLGDALYAEVRLIAVTGRGVVHNYG